MLRLASSSIVHWKEMPRTGSDFAVTKPVRPTGIFAKSWPDLQHRLCAYCEAVLIDGNVQVEHVVPQARGRVLDPTNMMVCCLGGTKDVADEDRYLPPVNDNMSCGQAKSGQTDPDFFDPRTLPALPSLVRVRYTGEIEADSNACMATGVPADHVRNTIGMLGLNVRRLQRARQQRWSDLLASFGGLENPDWVTAAARQELALDQRGHLPAFFTTARSFFGLVPRPLLVNRRRHGSETVAPPAFSRARPLTRPYVRTDCIR